MSQSALSTDERHPEPSASKQTADTSQDKHAEHWRPSNKGHFNSFTDPKATVNMAHTVVETFRQVFQDDPEVLEARTIKNVERTRNSHGQEFLNTLISVHYIGHTDQPWPSWPWSKSPLMHTDMPPEMNHLYSEDLYRQHLQESNRILRRYMFNRYPKILLLLLFILLIIFIIVIRTLYIWKTVYFAWVFAFALAFLVLFATMRIRAIIGMKKLKKLEQQWNDESSDAITFEFNSVGILYFVRLFITVKTQDKQTIDAAAHKFSSRQTNVLP